MATTVKKNLSEETKYEEVRALIIKMVLESAPRGLSVRDRAYIQETMETDRYYIKFTRGRSEVSLELAFEADREEGGFGGIEDSAGDIYRRMLLETKLSISGYSRTSAEALVEGELIRELALFALELEQFFSQYRGIYQLLETKAERDKNRNQHLARELVNANLTSMRVGQNRSIGILGNGEKVPVEGAYAVKLAGREYVLSVRENGNDVTVTRTV